MARSSTLALGSANVLRQTEKAFCPPGPGKPRRVAIGQNWGNDWCQCLSQNKESAGRRVTRKEREKRAPRGIQRKSKRYF